MKKATTKKKPTPNRTVKFEGVSKSGTTKDGGKWKLTVGTIEIELT